jgi:hypothetical protein
MSKKTIDINPDLFNVGGKTRKNREKKQKLTSVPLISPNVLKNKLLKRIKEHKKRETEGLDNNKKKLPEPSIVSNTNINTSKPNLVDLEEYNDEFNDSINYLQTLSKQKKENEQKMLNEIKKQKMKEDLERKTLKNYQSLISSSVISSNTNLPHVNIDLPKELEEFAVPIIIQPQEQCVTLARPYNIDNSVPYGCLKGGVKPSYKDWNRTQKNMIVTDPKLSVVIDSKVSERENRLKQLKDKIKEKHNIFGGTVTPQIEERQIEERQIEERQIENNSMYANNVVTNNATPVITGAQEMPNKQFLKKTIRKKYTLGKTKNNRTVGVLIKDRNTRKQVLIAQRELKKKSVNDIKTYLKDHNLIKVGSSAPNDVIRKMYEASMLAGEITNSNTDTLLHNLMKDDKEL